MAEQQDAQSKRERQKARRQARREQELARARREQATGKAAKVVGLLLVLGLLGWFVGNWVVDWRREADLKAAARDKLAELGCEQDRIQPDAEAGHIEDPAAVAPKAIYTDRPASSGPHLATVIKSGVYDELIDERLMVHNLEHGYVNVYYSPDAPEDQVERMKDVVREKLGDGNPKMIVAPKIGTWSDEEKNFAFVAWRFRQMCEEFDEGVLLNFIEAHYGLKGQAPEKSVAAHMGGSGVLDPEEDEGPLVLPPLTAEDTDPDPAGASAPPSPGASDAAGTDATEESTASATAEPSPTASP